MSDRELLERAAKAAMRAGFKLECPDDPDGIYVCRDVRRNGHTWSPLTDDGDAMRLSVSLQLDVLQDALSITVKKWCQAKAEPVDLACVQIDGDRFESTRRAIVRAAAEIGRAMP